MPSLEQLKKKIIEANPKKYTSRNRKMGTVLDDFRLADVLLMIGKLKVIRYKGEKFVTHPHNVSVTTLGYALNENGMHLFEWNLAKDSLDDQSPETIEFLNNLL